MTFKEAAEAILRRAGRPLHYKELAEQAMERKLLTFVGRTPELTMQSQLTDSVKKAPGNPFVRVKPGVFGLLRYPELSDEEKRQEELAKQPSKDSEKPGVQPSGPRGERRRRPAEESEEAGRSRRRRRRGGRGRMPAEAPAAATPQATQPDAGEVEEEPPAAIMSPETRAATLAETGVLDMRNDEGEEDEEELPPEGGPPPSEQKEPPEGAPGAGEKAKADDDEESGAEVEETFGSAKTVSGAATAGGADEDLAPGRHRRRRRRRRGADDGMNGTFAAAGASAAATPVAPAAQPEIALGGPEAGAAPAVAAATSNGGMAAPTPALPGATALAPPPTEVSEPAGRKIMTPLDAAIEVLRGQAPGRGIHVRQIADSAVRRRLVHGEPNEAWRVIRAALAAEPKGRLRAGLRPRVRAAGSGLFALARRSPDPEIEQAEQVFGEARRALRERTILSLERRIAELPAPAFEALARVLMQREGFGPATFVKRVEGTIYLEALRGRGSRPSRCLVALRPGATTAGRRAIGELRAGIRARNQEEGLIMLAGRLAEDAITEWKQAGTPVEIADGPALAETCVRHGVGVIGATVSVDFVDADFFAELTEG